MDQSTRIVLLDNGSLKPDAVFSLRRIAGKLSERLRQTVHPVSLLHSSKIASDKLDGKPADTWRRFLKGEVENGAKRFLCLPLFFGPSSAICDYLPQITAKDLGDHVGIDLRVAKHLVDPTGEDTRIAEILSELTLEKLEAAETCSPPVVVLVDHGSPVAAVAEVRDLVANQLEAILGGRISRVVAASMERREGSEYDFNEPLLETALNRLASEGVESAILSLMFLSPGRHAGAGGDIADIVAESDWARLGKELPVCDLVGSSEKLIDVLESRYSELIESL